MRITSENFRVVDPARAPVVLEWEFGRRPAVRRVGAGLVPMVHAYRLFDGQLHEAAAPHHDWFGRLVEGGEAESSLPGLDRAVLIDGLLWRPSSGPVFFPFASVTDGIDDPEAPLRYVSTVVMSTNYGPEDALGPLMCFSVTDLSGASQVLGEAIGRPDLGPTAGVVVSRGELPDIEGPLLQRNVREVFRYIAAKCADGELGTGSREDLAAVVELRRVLAAVGGVAPVPVQQVLDAIPAVGKLVENHIEMVEGDRERPRRGPARRRNLRRSEQRVWLRQSLDVLSMLRVQCERQLDRGNELAGLRL